MALRHGWAARRGVSSIARRADYVVVGAGSAGCVLTHRLSASGASVLLLEAGGDAALRDSGRLGLISRMPTALAMPMHERAYNWAYETEPSPALNGRRVSCPRGRGLGGSSAINGMVYVRGHARDYDAWDAAMGGDGAWCGAAVLPYFRRMEAVCAAAADADADDAASRGALRGVSGPMQVKHGTNALGSPLYAAFIAAGAEAGYGTPPGDYNGSRQEGLSPMPMTVFHERDHARRGERCSAAAAYLEAAETDAVAHPRLRRVTGARARRVLFDASADGPPRACAVEYADDAGCVHVASADREVVLCAGAIESPHLLQLSGVGPPALLDALGIPVVSPLDGVGANLQDHLASS